MIRVLLADDQALIREGFRLILELEEGMEVVGEAGDGRQAVELARLHKPDVVLMDIEMPGLDRDRSHPPTSRRPSCAARSDADHLRFGRLIRTGRCKRARPVSS